MAPKFLNVLLVVSSLILCSCNDTPSNVRRVLKLSKDNQQELKKVIKHYQQIGDKEKLAATYFLIANMYNKYSFDEDKINKYNIIFEVLDSLHLQSYNKNGYYLNELSPKTQLVYDSLMNVIGHPQRSSADVVMDYNKITADVLIDNIDFAFKMKRTTPWGKSTSLEDFYEYVLPYRTGSETLEDWRRHLKESYSLSYDTVDQISRVEVAKEINDYIFENRIVRNKITFWSYPYSMTVDNIEKARFGSCKHLVSYMTKILRAQGIPVAVVNTPAWGDRSRGHDWNAIILENDSIYPFDAVSENFAAEFEHKLPKVYQETFSNKRNVPLNTKDVPGFLLDENKIDVTDKYVKSYDIEVPINNFSRKKYALICTFNDKSWTPVDYGDIKGGKAHFRKMGGDIAYLITVYENNNFVPVSHPFILNKEGQLIFIKSNNNKLQNMSLTRKYPCFNRIKDHMKSILGSKIQGANKPDFSDAIDLYTVEEVPDKYVEVKINNKTKFRYVRFTSAIGEYANVGEVEFYGGGKKDEQNTLNGNLIGNPTEDRQWETPFKNAMDKDPGTYFFGIDYDDNCGWVGLDLGKPHFVNKIRYCPRSDTNFILIGDVYELCFWDNGQWVSMGKQIADKQSLFFENVPSEGLYLLHNLSRGKEERIFTYENDKQVWW